MTESEVLTLFINKIPTEQHMLLYFSKKAACGILLPFLSDLVRAISEIDFSIPGYAVAMIDRLAQIKGTGEPQYEVVIQVLCEIYVMQGVVASADRSDAGHAKVIHEPCMTGQKNPECEALIAGYWCAIEVKAPQLIKHSINRSKNELQETARWPFDISDQIGENRKTRPRDNPVKDFLISAETKFAAYEVYRRDAFRILVIIWDDFLYEPISALIHPISGLLTSKSFHCDDLGNPVTYPHIDGIILIRHQHQIYRSTRCEPMIDGVSNAMVYRHDGFPFKAFIPVPGGRVIPSIILDQLNAFPIEECLASEYLPLDLVMWF